MAVALSLPRATAVTEELLSPVRDVQPEDLRTVRAVLAGALAPLAAEIPAGARLVLDGYRFALARRRPERCALEEQAFSPSPAACRRAVGLAAVERCVRRRAVGPAQAVTDVLAAGEDDAAAVGPGGDRRRAQWWAPWYASLAAGGRAVVTAEAVTWATQLWSALDWDRVGRPVVVGGPDVWWDLPDSRTLVMKGRADVRARVGTRPVLVVVGSGIPDSHARAELLFPALVAAMAGGPAGAPGRVLGLWPASGQVRVVPVDAAGLERCAEEVVAATATWVDGLLERAGPTAARAG